MIVRTVKSVTKAARASQTRRPYLAGAVGQRCIRVCDENLPDSFPNVVSVVTSPWREETPDILSALSKCALCLGLCVQSTVQPSGSSPRRAECLQQCPLLSTIEYGSARTKAMLRHAQEEPGSHSAATVRSNCSCPMSL